MEGIACLHGRTKRNSPGPSLFSQCADYSPAATITIITIIPILAPRMRDPMAATPGMNLMVIVRPKEASIMAADRTTAITAMSTEDTLPW